MNKKQLFSTFTAACLLASPLFGNSILDQKGPGGYSITGFDRESKVSIGGYFDTEFFYDKEQLQIDNHRFILEAAAQLHPNLLFNSEFEIEHGGTVYKIEQAWVDYKFSDALINRTGLIVVPFGRINTLHDSDVRDTTNRPLYAKKIVPSTWCDTGTGIRGSVDLNDNLEVNYDLFLVNGLLVHDHVDGEEDDYKINSKDGVRNARSKFKKTNGKYDNNKNKAITGRFSVSPMLGLEVASSFYTGKYDDANEHSLNMIGFDGYYKTGPFELVGEYAHIDAKNSYKMYGYYVEGHYHFSPSFIKQSIVGRLFKNPHFTLFGRFGAVDMDTSNDNDTKLQSTFGINFRPVETVVYKVEYEINSDQKTDVQDNKVWTSVAVGF